MTLTVIILLIFFTFNPNTEYKLSKWFLISVIAAGFLSYSVSKCTSIPVGLLLFYAICSASYYGIFPFHEHFSNDVNGPNSSLAYICLRNLAATFAIGCVLAFTPSSVVFNFFHVIPFITILAGIRSLFAITSSHKIFDKDHIAVSYGFSCHPSPNSVLLAFFAMACLWEINTVSIIAIIVAFIGIIRSKASSGLGAFIAGMTTYFAFTHPLLSVLSVLSVSLFLILDRTLYDSRLLLGNGRLELILDSFKYFWMPMNKLTGVGAGSASVLFANAMLKDKENSSYFKKCSGVIPLNLHNDVLQWFFEGGIVGFILALAALISVVLVSWGNPAAMAFIACYLVASLTNFPNHLADTSLITALVLRQIFT